VHLLNLGILAHVDAGKTSLTERLLFNAGVIGEIGRVDDGSTQTDSLALERQRGITIKAAVVSFQIGDVTVNLIDTPGHPDFIAEVERTVGMLDGAVLVVSAVEGVQAQTRVLMRTLRRLGIPTLIFVNKLDRGGAGFERVLASISARLSPAAIAMGTASRAGTRDAGWTPYGENDAAFRDELADQLTQRDDPLLAAYLDDQRVPFGRLKSALAAQTRRALVYPVYGGSAITGAGLEALTGGIAGLLPAAAGDSAGPGRATVFKVERGMAGDKVAYARVFAGTLRVREPVRYGNGQAGKLTAIAAFDGGPAAPALTASSGQIAKLRGLADVRIGDKIVTECGQQRSATVAGERGGSAGPGNTGAHSYTAAHSDTTGHGDAAAPPGTRYFAPPTLQAVVDPARPADRPALHAALVQIAEQDPLINLRHDDVRQELLVSLYGDVQKEVIQATLADEFGLEVAFRETTVICTERVVGTGAAAEFMDTGTNPFRATVGLRIGPTAPGTAVDFRLGIERGALPNSFLKAVEDTVRQTLAEGIFGWQVPDCVVTLTHSGYVPPPPYGWSKHSSSASDFRLLTPLVLMAALQQAGTVVCEPVSGFRLELPAVSLPAVLSALGRLAARSAPARDDGASCVVEGEIPAGRVHELQHLLPGLTGGEGTLESWFSRYQGVRGTPPLRRRTDHNPLCREEYLLHVQHRV